MGPTTFLGIWPDFSRSDEIILNLRRNSSGTGHMFSGTVEFFGLGLAFSVNGEIFLNLAFVVYMVSHIF